MVERFHAIMIDASFCIFEKALFLNPWDSILETQSYNVSSIEARGLSLEARVSSVNLLLSGTVHCSPLKKMCLALGLQNNKLKKAKATTKWWIKYWLTKIKFLQSSVQLVVSHLDRRSDCSSRVPIGGDRILLNTWEFTGGLHCVRLRRCRGLVGKCTVNTGIQAALFCSKFLYQIGDAAYLREHLDTMP